ncbi:MAG: hypothetical protein RLZZ293_148 [Pseudomonadota bacterium]|jgi:putative Holliday junction resolvase
MPEFNILGLDYGDMRLGVAVANNLLQIAHPLITISGEGMWQKIDQLAPLITKWQPQLLVLGMPELNAQSNLQKIQLCNTINNFAKRIGRKFNLPVELVNEAYSSAYASQLLTQQGIYARQQQGKLDQLAACAILQTYFQLK